MLTTFHQLFLIVYLPYIHILHNTQPLHNVDHLDEIVTETTVAVGLRASAV